MSIGTAASVTSAPRSAMRARITRSWQRGMNYMFGLAKPIRLAGRAGHATGRPSAPSPSTPNATRSSRRIRATTIDSRRLHE